MSTRTQRRSRRRHSRRALSVGALLGLGLGITAIPAPANAAPLLTGPSEIVNKNPAFDPDALRLSTTTDTLPATDATQYQARVGDPVRRVYVLHNNGLLPLVNVTVSDPDAANIQCDPTATPTIATLLPLTSAACEATFTAAPGEHNTTIAATGTVFLLGATVSDTAAAGYTAVAPALTATLTLNGGKSATNLPAGSPVSAVLTIVNSGSATLSDVTPLAPQPPLSILGCGAGPLINILNPSESAFCTGALIPAPGTHVTSVTITATWPWTQPITAQGPQNPQALKIQTVADATYTGTPPTSPPPPPPPTPGAVSSSPTPPPPNPATPPSTPAAAFPPPFPPPTPSLSPSPHAPTPFPAPAGAAIQAVSQFRASRGLSLPLKVLVIVVIPVVAAAAGAHRLVSRR